MPVKFVNCTASSPMISRGLYRVTWAQQLALGLVATGDVQKNLQLIYSGGLDGKGLGYAASQPAVAPDDKAGTLDIRAPTLARGTVAEFATELQNLADNGFNLAVVRVELVPAGEGSAAAAAGRDRATADATAAVSSSSLTSKLQTLAQRAAIGAAVLVGVYWFITHKSRGGQSW